MIHNFDGISGIISQHIFVRDTEKYTLTQKIDRLEEAIKKSVYALGSSILQKQSKVHLALSGGVDSSTLLAMLVKENFPVVVHTLASNEHHPDMHYATLFAKSLGVEHKRHVFKSTEDVSKYYMLFESVSGSTRRIICGDCIDELLGGYYAHRDPSKLPVYTATKSMDENRLSALEYHMGKLLENHLIEQDDSSTKLRIEVYLPYADKDVFSVASRFSVAELVDDENRKKPMLEIASRNGVPKDIIERRKYGLVNVMDDIVNYTYVDEFGPWPV